jgi:hypothetical protein
MPTLGHFHSANPLTPRPFLFAQLKFDVKKARLSQEFLFFFPVKTITMKHELVCSVVVHLFLLCLFPPN